MDTFRNIYSVPVVLVFTIVNHNTTLSGQIYLSSEAETSQDRDFILLEQENDPYRLTNIRAIYQ
jgi:hypothetical protein